MTHIRTIELHEIIADFPDVEKLSGFPSKIDLFICALGFEERCLAVPQRLAESGVEAKACFYLELDTNSNDNQTNLDELLLSFGKITNDVQCFNADSVEFEAEMGYAVEQMIRPDDQPLFVVFDISVAANRLLLRAFKQLFEARTDLTIVYSEAEVYHPTQAEFEQDCDKWVDEENLGTEIGVSSIYPSSEYAGQHLDPLPNCVVLFPSFRKERSRAVICKVDETLVTTPRDNVLWILGNPASSDNQWRTLATKVINEVPEDAYQFSVSTFDYRETLQRLELIYREKWLRFNITISPLGAKLQAIGTAIFCFLRPEVKLMFAAPQRYNAKEWSSGCGAQWKIEFGPTERLRKKIRRVGEIEIV